MIPKRVADGFEQLDAVLQETTRFTRNTGLASGMNTTG